MISIIFLAAGASLIYQAAAILAGIRHLLAPETDTPHRLPPISVLKPVSGAEPGLYDAISSHARQDYQEFELLFGTTQDGDPANDVIRRLAAEFPHLRVRLIMAPADTPNQKVGLLENLADAARYSILLVNDSDISVPADYLRRVVAPLSDPRTGVVTCLYRACGSTAAARWEALGVAADFAPSVLVARLAGAKEFGLGSTLVFRRAQLEEIGGFRVLADYIADDYQLSRRITALGFRSVLSKVVVETRLAEDSWTGVWKHQVRWARTIRVSRPGGYLGLPVTHAGVWALLCGLTGNWPFALALLFARVVAGILTGVAVLRSSLVRRCFLLIPLWDLWAFAVWVAGLSGRTVEWRGRKLALSRDGRIKPVD